MKVVELHPEELLDREARGELTPSERIRLDSHLEKCVACRFEREARADFAGELEGEDRISKVPLLVEGAIKESPSVAPKPVPEEKRELPSPRRRATGKRALVFFAAAAVMLAGVAAASSWSGRIWQPAPKQIETTTPATTTTTRVEHAPKPALPKPAEADDPVSVPVPVPETTSATPPLKPATPAITPARPMATAPAITTASTTTSTTGTALPTATASAPPTAAETSATIFDEANAARRRGDHARAITLYRDLQDRYPNTTEARVSRVALARLQLDEDDAKGALSGFDAYLRTGGAELREEAMAGRALALGKLGRTDEEARAWSALLDAYPHTPYAARARAKLNKAGAP
jgi:TolA-binding protein